MASLYIFSCQGCDRKRAFAHEFDAAREGWFLAQVRHADALRHWVRCPDCVPAWAKAAMDLPARPERRKPREVK